MKNKKVTNPIRFTSLSICLFFVLFIIQGTLESVHGQWTKDTIDSYTNYSAFIEAYDIESDGDMDLFVAEEEGDGNVLFYENNNNISWTKHKIDSAGGKPSGLDLADLDNDGNMDVIVGCFGADIVVWYRNNGGFPIQWSKDTIDDAHDGPAALMAEDINGDNIMDVVVRYYGSGEIIWFKNNLPTGWEGNLIGTDMTGYGNLCVGDIDNDDRPDVVKSVQDRNEVRLFKNNLPNNNWTEVKIDDNMTNTWCSDIADINNDGNMDIISASIGAPSGEADVAWYENDGTGQTWTKNSVTVNMNGVKWIDVVKIDSNEYLDIVVAGDNSVVLYMNEDGGQNWTEDIVDDNLDGINTISAFDIDLDGDFDIVPSRETGALVWYENPLGSAHTVSLNASPTLVKPQSDLLTITAVLDNPDNHPVHVFTVIQGDQSGFVDTLQLYDDGLHGDSLAQDNVWANTRITTDLSEEAFKVDIITYDSTRNDKLGFNPPARFFTLGPIEFESYSIDPDFFCNKTVPKPGGCLNLKLTLKNYSLLATAKNISAELVSLDTLISFITGTSEFPEILAGDNSVSNKYQMLISEEWPGDENIPIRVNISSYGTVCWTDTMYIVATNVKHIKSPTTKIYPNPADDILTIELERDGFYEIEITSINVKTLYSGRMEGATHQIDLSSFQKGVYLITVRSKDFIETKKLIKLK